ncbi:type IX secretion system sortase PorU [Rubrivirga sp.]|uniref:type IX secretion system sortase PorU n=1 Tax=Rubrivirga sp. TaxID=1885344 RepID=UPI003B51F700
MSRLAFVYVVAAVFAAGPVSAQQPVRYQATVPQHPVVRVIEETPTAVTVEVTAHWRTPLAEAVDKSGGDLETLVALAAGGRPVVSHEIQLGSAVPPAVTVVSFEGDELALPAAADEAGLGGAVAEVVAIGERRRELVGSLAVRLLRVENGRLVRARRVVVRVPRPPVAARLAARGDDNPHLAVDRSALAEGRWFKVPIPESGVYRIDAAFLRDSLGVQGSVPLSSVAVYGTGGRILPAVTSTPRPADLLEVPSLVVGDGLLFYAEGPQWWDWVPEDPSDVTEGEWVHDISPFSVASYYFLRLDAPSPLRILSGAVFPGWPDATVVGEVEDRRFYEVDQANLERDRSGSGLDWFGPQLDVSGGAFQVLNEPVAGAGPGAPVSYRARVASQASPAVTIAMVKDGRTLATGRPTSTSASSGETGNLANVDRIEAETTLGGGLAVSFRVTNGHGSAKAWLDWVEAVVRRPATAGADRAVTFPTPGGQSGRFEIPLGGFASEPQVWDVTEPGAIRQLGVRADGGTFRVQVAAEGARPREIVAFDPSGPALKTPLGVSTVADRVAPAAVAVANQNLHGLATRPDYVVVTHPDFRASADRLAAHRQADGLSTVVVTTEQVFNEFAGGTGDMRAVRDYMKFLYDRAPADEIPRYLLLFGDGHFNYRRLRNQGASNETRPGPIYVPPFETENMINRTASYTSDDYFGLLGDDEGEWEYYGSSTLDRIDLGIGRIPSRTAADAETVVNKIVRYESPATRGEWRTRFTFVADDQYPRSWDRDLHVLNADGTAEVVEAVDPTITLGKIYGPAYPSVITARGRVRPQVTEDIQQAINGGTLVWNYSGHGGPSGLGDEDYMTEAIVARLDNADRLPVFVTATCSFGKFDIAHEQSLAEQILLRSGGGGVAMLTTVRLVYTSSNPDALNYGLNRELTAQMLTREPDGRPARLGDALYRTKNTAVGAAPNNRKFNLLGDPAMRLGLPERSIAVEVPDQFEAFAETTVSGQILGLDGQPDPTYRGEVSISVFDAERLVELPPDACCWTDGPDADFLGDYRSRIDQLFSGRASVQGGRFSTTFRVPQDVSYSGLPARVVAYALGEDGSDGAGQSTRATVATTAAARPDDGEGPEIRLFVNDSTFVDGGPTSPQGVLVARLLDASGLNTVGAGVGHELLVTVDGDAARAIDVGRYYQGDLDTYRAGTVRVPLSALGGGEPLAPGAHTATITAWDALNNASTATVSFVVVDDGLVVRSVLPYPNPTAGPARFFVEHNQPVGTSASVQLRIYTLAGRPVRTIDGDEALPGDFLSTRTVQIPWDGLDDDGDRLGSGVYLVRLRMEMDDPAGGTRVAERVERLAVIR